MSTLSVGTIKSISTTAPVFQNTSGTEKGQLCKSWVQFDGRSTPSIADSFNVSSLTDVATGKTTININNDMGNVNYSGYYFTSASTGTAYSNFGNAFTGGFGSFATGSCSQNAYTSTNFDSYQNLVGIFGDLA